MARRMQNPTPITQPAPRSVVSAISGILTNLPTTGRLHPHLPSQLHDSFLGVGIAPLSTAPMPEQLCYTKPLQAWGPVTLMCTAFL